MFLLAGVLTSAAEENPRVLMTTTMGEMLIELYPDKAPVSVENFLQYVRDGFYDGVIFHRIVPDFVIQGGGFDSAGNRKETRDPIVNEAANGLKNKKYTLSYARTPEINSATSQFFINTVDNPALDHRGNTQDEFGYCVFGKVIEGRKTVDKIAKIKTGGPRGDSPTEVVVIVSASIAGDDDNQN
ncbi:MAG TPA: peptidyl-prolyl cis-trans isomerase [bacterium]|nr:peptidyl-prolyl cis-trans isomerase [bacterium]